MNDIVLQQATRTAVKPKFRGHKKLKSYSELRSVVIPHYPANIEREYMRVSDSYMAMLHDVIKKHLPKILRSYKNLRLDDEQTDINYEFYQIASEFTEMSDAVHLEMKLGKIAEMAKKMSIEQWKKICQRTLGINILDDYYKGEFYREAIQMWVEANVNLITTIKTQTLDKMRGIIQEGWQNGRLVRNIAADINTEYNIGKRRARLIARDQIGKLNGAITRSQQTDAGVSEYIWSTVQDERVRDRHADLNGKRFKWGEPPIVDTRTGRRAEPGEDYQCRCVALPVFDIDTLNLVFEKVDGTNK